MMITRATEYACLAMLYLAKQRPGTVCFTAEIAEAEHIPPAFLVKVMPKLVKAGLVTSRRGSNGGIELAKPAKEITMRTLVEVIEGEIAANVCTSSQPFSCFRSGCALRGAFQQAQERVLESLEGVTLA
ncbi:MAG TPA: Rrf2 family transcriptional regulator, partial [Oscillatoriaceae cyanobacterium]